jgi:putative ABC transport system permease protein
LLGATLSIALAVAFISSLGAFVTSSAASLTARSAASVGVDWQVQVTAQGRPADVRAALAKVPDVREVLPVDYATVPSLSATGSSGARTTGQARLVALPPGYTSRVPGQVRYLLGSHSGVLLQQQTAANLAVGPGGGITVSTAAGPAHLTVGGVVDLPHADSFFQVVGTTPGTGASAPPDNVLLLPQSTFDRLTAGLPVVHQFHVVFGRGSLPSDPAAAATAITQRAQHFEAAVAGGALVGNNLGAALSGARQDALYARLLFLLLGLPGLALAAVVAALVVALGADRRRRDMALLRLRGASPGALISLAAGETALTGLLGIAGGIPLALLAVDLALPGRPPLAVGWTVGAALTGLVLAAATQLGPAVRTARRRGAEQVSAAAAKALPIGQPWPLRLGLDVVLLAAAALTFALTARGGYQVVVVPEGVPVSSVNYAALLGPALAWPGLALLVWRASSAVMARRTGRFARQRPGRAPELEAASLRRRRRTVARGAAGLAVALGLAASTAVFTSTYDAQAKLDVALTVGADVTVTEAPGSQVPPSAAAAIATAPGVQAVQPLQHRLAYVGPDLQDLYGIRPTQIGTVAPLRDSFVPGSTIHAALTALARTPDGALLSAETIKDYQLHVGDLVRLRLQTGPQHTYQPVPFHVIGVVKEFPTAPKDSFIIANAAYLTQVTGSNAVSSFLIRSSNPPHTAAALRASLPGVVTVTDIVSARKGVTTASGLAATDLAGLARLELGFGVVLALACSGLALALGISERRRALVLLAALGATARQRGRFLSAEARALLAGGLLGGAGIGATIAYLLVKVLNGIFDPPPSGLAVPFGYLAVLGAAVLAVSAAVLLGLGRLAARAGPSQLRDL